MNLNIKVTTILYHWLLILDQFHFCETHFTTYQFVAIGVRLVHSWADQISAFCIYCHAPGLGPCALSPSMSRNMALPRRSCQCLLAWPRCRRFLPAPKRIVCFCWEPRSHWPRRWRPSCNAMKITRRHLRLVACDASNASSAKKGTHENSARRSSLQFVTNRSPDAHAAWNQYASSPMHFENPGTLGCANVWDNVAARVCECQHRCVTCVHTCVRVCVRVCVREFEYLLKCVLYARVRVSERGRERDSKIAKQQECMSESKRSTFWSSPSFPTIL